MTPITILSFAGAGAFVTAAVAVLGVGVRGPTVQDRAVAVNAVGTLTVVIVVLLGAALAEPGFLDVALVYALLNFLLSLGLGRLLTERAEVSS